MKKRTVIALIIASALLITGLVLCTVGLACTGWNWRAISSEGTMTEKTAFYSAGEVSELLISDRNTPLIIREGSDERIRVSYGENDRKKYTVSCVNGRLEITGKTEKFWQNWFSFGFSRGTALTVELPRGYEGRLKANTTNAGTEVSGISAVHLELQNSNGRITLQDLTIREFLVCKTSNASIKGVRIHADRADLKSSNGKISLQDLSAGDSAFCETSNAAITLQRVSVGSRLQADTSNAGILLNDLEAKTILLDSSNGNIEGNILGKETEYAIRSHTSNGSNSLPTASDGGPGELRADTSNGNIRVRFGKD